MKKLITSTLIVMVTITTFAQAQQKTMKSVELVKVKNSDAPGGLEAQVQQDFSNAGPVNIFTAADTTVTSDWKVSEEINFEEGDHIDYYHVEMKGKDSYYEALYDSNNKLIMSKEIQKDAALPQAIRTAYASSEYKDIPIAKDKHFKVTHHGNNKDYYVVYLKNGKKLHYNPDGTLVNNKNL
jgi:hypothetical protein